MKLIFLDIDGVLNDIDSRSRCGIYKGIDDDKVKRLKQIVDATDATIVLTSTWKMEWDRDKTLNTEMGDYLDRKLKRQKLHIWNKTQDDGVHRGQGILNYIEKYYDDTIENWIVLDDEVFCDYEELNILPHLIKTSFYGNDNMGGLQDHHVELAIKLLNKEEEINGLEKS